jgi:uncharacterized protein YfaS (alpha-2-macroglobulin family)
MGLADYARATSKGTAKVAIFLGEKRIGKRTIRGGAVFHLSKRLSKLEPGKLRIESNAPVYYEAHLSLARPSSKSSAISEGFTISREYLDFASSEPITEARLGKLIKVRIRVSSPETREHVAVVDPLPSGCEAVNEALETESYRYGSRRSKSSFRWSHRELHDDRATAFARRLSGEATFEYVLRATRPGSFTVPATHIEAMYAPGFQARTEATTFSVVR